MRAALSSCGRRQLRPDQVSLIRSHGGRKTQQARETGFAVLAAMRRFAAVSS